MAVRAAGAKLETPPEGWMGLYSYTDPTHGENIRKAEFNGVLGDMEGSNAYWDATKNATRGECAQILWNLTSFIDGGDIQPPQGDTGTVTQVVDGDTIHVQVGNSNRPCG